MSTPTVIFDLDGTLADTAEDVADMFSPLLVARGRRAMTKAEAVACFGLGAGRFAERAVALTGPAFDAGTQAALMAEFLAVYNSAVPVKAVLLPGAEAAVRACRAAGYRVGLCTNKPARATAVLLAHLGIDGLFDGVSGGDSGPTRKPDPGHLLDAIARAGGERAHSVMVGDSETDIAAAKAAGVPVVLIAGGYLHGDAMQADHVIHNFAELAPLLAAMFTRAE